MRIQWLRSARIQGRNWLAVHPGRAGVTIYLSIYVPLRPCHSLCRPFPLMINQEAMVWTADGGWCGGSTSSAYKPTPSYPSECSLTLALVGALACCSGWRGEWAAESACLDMID